MERKGRQCVFGIVCVVLLTAVDQAAKYMAVEKLKGGGGFPLIPGVFELFYLENRGAAFGMLANRQWFFILIALVMLAVSAYVYCVLPRDRHFHAFRFCTVLIAAGAAGNMIDRIARGFVVDFLYVSLIDFPVFNIADCYVVVGAILLAALLFTMYRADDLEFLRPGRGNQAE